MGCLAGWQHLRLVHGVAQEAVPEAVPSQPDFGDRLNDRGVLETEQGLVDRPPGQLAQRLHFELGAERGRQLRHAQVDSRCPKAGRQDLVDSGRENLAAVRGDGAAGQLLEKEGDAGAALDDEPTLTRIQATVGQCRHQPCRLLLLERLQLDVED